MNIKQMLARELGVSVACIERALTLLIWTSKQWSRDEILRAYSQPTMLDALNAALYPDFVQYILALRAKPQLLEAYKRYRKLMEEYE